MSIMAGLLSVSTQSVSAMIDRHQSESMFPINYHRSKSEFAYLDTEKITVTIRQAYLSIKAKGILAVYHPYLVDGVVKRGPR